VVFYSALSFGIGTFVNFGVLSKPNNLIKVAVVVAHLAVGIWLIALGKIESPIFKEAMILFGIYASIMFISLLQNVKPISKFLLFMNKYSLQIYLLHTIFTAGIRIILMRVNITSWVIHVIVGTLCGIVFSVLAAVVAKKIKILNVFFFPTKTYKQLKTKA
jgi:peptidoglycan/LPS O-acetylase OafA/YrhL